MAISIALRTELFPEPFFPPSVTTLPSGSISTAERRMTLLAVSFTIFMVYLPSVSHSGGTSPLSLSA